MKPLTSRVPFSAGSSHGLHCPWVTDGKADLLRGRDGSCIVTVAFSSYTTSFPQDFSLCRNNSLKLKTNKP